MIAARSTATGFVNKLSVFLIFFWFANATDADPLRARDLGIPFDGTPGPLNAITDVEVVPVGQHLRNDRVFNAADEMPTEAGSIIIVAATDAPLLPHQLKRIAKRTTLGLARVGGIGGNGSGDIFIAFSTANANAGQAAKSVSVRMLPNEDMGSLFLATVEATAEAIINALVAGRNMTGDRGHSVKGIDHNALIEVLREYNRYVGE